jgi:hypothetical protein
MVFRIKHLEMAGLNRRVRVGQYCEASSPTARSGEAGEVVFAVI